MVLCLKQKNRQGLRPWAPSINDVTRFVFLSHMGPKATIIFVILRLKQKNRQVLRPWTTLSMVQVILFLLNNKALNQKSSPMDPPMDPFWAPPPSVSPLPPHLAPLCAPLGLSGHRPKWTPLATPMDFLWAPNGAPLVTPLAPLWITPSGSPLMDLSWAPSGPPSVSPCRPPLGPLDTLWDPLGQRRLSIRKREGGAGRGWCGGGLLVFISTDMDRKS